MANRRERYNNNLNISGRNIREIRNEKKLSREVLSAKLLLLEEVNISAQAIRKLKITLEQYVIMN